MNKILKRISIVALGFLLVGTGFTVCGLLLGGTTVFSYSLGKPVNTSRRQSYKMVTEEIEPVHSIQVDTNYFDVKVVSGETFSVTYPEGEYIDSGYTVKNDELDFTVYDKAESDIQVVGFWDFHSFFLDNNAIQDDTIVVTIPDNTSLKDITIHNSDGDCLIEGQSTDNYLLDLSYGDLELKNCTGKNIEIKDDDGEVSIISCDFDSMNGELAYGDCYISDSSIGTSEFELSDGSLTLDNGSVSAITGKLSYGDFTINHTQIGQVNANMSDGDFIAELNQAQDVFSTNLETECGEITINEKEQGSHYKTIGSDKKAFTVESSYGDIDIQFGK